jgi:transglutaminase-like putative cysteine protease
VQFEFDHYEQHFVVDPGQVGAYDTESALYREYTASAGNIAITPEIEAAANEAVGEEVNPYLAARKIYDYVLENIAYSFMPHSALWPRGEPESVYVHEHRCGDCGAQSMYFSALCRAAGIPARTTGGWQLFSGNFAGHFWAEFYLPNYGWIPVDTTAAEIADYIPGLSEEELEDFHDFFFGSQDHLRCNVQKDVDEPLVPPATQPVMVSLALQQPAYNCDTMEEIPVLVLSDYWSISAEVLGE